MKRMKKIVLLRKNEDEEVCLGTYSLSKMAKLGF